MSNAPKRFAEMTANEIRGWLDVRGAYNSGFADLRDAIRQEALSDGMAIGTAEINEMSSTIDALRTRAERALEERDDAKADFLHAHNARVFAESALGEARREGAREALGCLHEWWADTALRTVTSFTVAQNIAAFRAREYPATPSGEGVTQHTTYPTGAFAATPQPERLEIPVEDGMVVRITPSLARRLFALAQTTTEGA